MSLLPTADNILSRLEPSQQTILTLKSYHRKILAGVLHPHFESHKYTVYILTCTDIDYLSAQVLSSLLQKLLLELTL